VYVLSEGVVNATKIEGWCLWHTEALLLVVNWNIRVVYLFLVSLENGENLDLAERET
jgi:hypothetical protein